LSSSYILRDERRNGIEKEGRRNRREEGEGNAKGALPGVLDSTEDILKEICRDGAPTEFKKG
jgi:hypothetical protein